MSNRPGPGGPGRGPGGHGPGGNLMVQKPRDAKKTLRRLVAYLADRKAAMLLIVLICVFSALVSVVATRINGIIIDDFIDTGDVLGLARICLVLLAIYLTNVIAQFFQQRMMVRVAQDTTAKLRRDLFAHLSGLKLSYFDTHNSGDLMSRLTNDVDTISMTLSQSVAQLFSGVVSLLGTLAAMLILSPLLTLISIVIMPLMFLSSRSVLRVTRRYFKQQQAALGELNGFVEERVSGQRVVKLFSHEEASAKEFDQLNQRLRKTGTIAQSLSGLMGPMMNMINNISYLVIAVSGGYLAARAVLTVGDVFSFLQYTRQFSQPLNSIANTINTVQSALAAAERVFAVMDEEPEADAPGAKPLQRLNGDIELKNVTFGYEPGKPILKDASLHAEPGRQIAIVGPTGAGKTTIISLLTRFYDADAGQILFDGVPVAHFTRDSVRRNIGMVLQDTYLFCETVRDNIRYGRPDATDEEVVEAAKTANAHSFIIHLPQGYDTVVQDNGSNLSQGQRQLLAIARAVLANPRLLILDEATSSIDTRTELKIQEALLALMQGRTSFIIAHRLSTIQNADEILVVDDGRIVERGTHQQLLAKEGGFYAHLYNSQFKTGMAL